MKTPRILTTTIALLLTATILHAQTWDGGDAALNNFNAANNWNPNAVPVNTGAANLIFAGAVRLTPVVNVNFDVNGVTFNNTAGAFNISAGVATALTVRGGGITNNDADTQTFSTPVTFATGSSITAASGNVTISGITTLGTNTVTVSGAFDTTLASINGTGALVKNGTGLLNFNSNAAESFALNLNAGTISHALSATYSGTTSAVSAVGGTLFYNSNLTVSAGASFDVSGAAFSQAANRTFTVQSDGDATFAGVFTTDNTIAYRVTGTGSTFTTGGLALRDSSTIEVLSGGAFTSNGTTQIGAFGTTGSVLVDGATSSFTTSSGATFVVGSSASSTGSLTFTNGAIGTLPSADIVLANATGSSGTLTIKSGAQVSAGVVDVGHLTTSGTASVLVTGGGSKLTTTFNIADFSIGATSGGTGVVTVADGGEIALAGPLTVNETGTLNVNGGIVTMALSEVLTNNGTINFTAGRFSFGDFFNVGGGPSPLGTNLILTAGKEVIVPSSRTTTIGPASALVLDGGVFTTGSLVNSGGTLDFRRGTLRLTGSGAVSIGNAGPLGANLTLPIGATFSSSSTTTTISADGTLTVAGGNFASGNLTNNGSALIQAGSAATQLFTNSAGAQTIVGGTLTLNNTFTNATGARLELAGGSGRVIGLGALQNSGLLLGDGTITNLTTNAVAGKIRADTGRTLFFTGTFAANAGELQLQGGTLDFTGAITNGATGFITGRGALYAAGITNNGQMAFSSGTTDIHGDVTNAAGGRIVTSGAGTTTFFDDVIHNGTEIRTSAGGSSVFFGAVSGAGPYTGTGTVFFEGDLRPGNSPASVLYEGDLVLGGSATLTLELGGLLLGGEYDHLNVGGTFTADGALDVVLYGGFAPHFGDAFDLFDAGNIAGTFDTITLPQLGGGLAWDATQLASNGTLRVVPEPGIGALLASALALLGLRRRRSGALDCANWFALCGGGNLFPAAGPVAWAPSRSPATTDKSAPPQSADKSAQSEGSAHRALSETQSPSTFHPSPLPPPLSSPAPLNTQPSTFYEPPHPHHHHRPAPHPFHRPRRP